MDNPPVWSLPEHIAELGDLCGPDVVREILQLFLQDTPSRIASLAEAIQRGDGPAVSREAHGLKGGCVQIGAARLADLAARLEAPTAPAERRPLFDRIAAGYPEVVALIEAYLAAQP